MTTLEDCLLTEPVHKAMHPDHRRLIQPKGHDISATLAAEGYRRYGSTGMVDGLACHACKLYFSVSLYGWHGGSDPQCPVCLAVIPVRVTPELRLVATDLAAEVSEAVGVPALQIFICPPKCKAGGKPEEDGHIFDIPYDYGLESGFKCRCGTTNLSFDMWRAP